MTSKPQGSARPRRETDNAGVDVIHRHLKIQQATWRRVQIFAVQKDINLSQAFEAVMEATIKYEEEPQKIGPAIMRALKKLATMKGSERISPDDI